MMERQNFSVLHALLRRAHPNGRAVECAITARGADSQFIRRQILAQPLPAARAISVCRAQHLLRRAHPNGRNVKSVNPAHEAGSQPARKHMLAQFVLAKPAFYPSCARRTRFLPHYPSMIVMGYGAKPQPNDRAM